jgi:hypothetical protein
MKRKCRMGKLLTLEAPPIVVIESVSDSIALIKVWQATPITRRTGVGAISSTIRLSLAKCEAPGIGQVAAALAHAKMETFDLRLQDWVAFDGRTYQAVANAGFLFSVLCSGRSICDLDGVSAFSAVERHKSIRCLDVVPIRSNDLRLGGFFSAVAEGKMIRKLHVRAFDSGLYDPLCWKWLAYAFWSRASNACIPALNLGRIDFTEEHVAAIEAVLKYSYPQPVEHPAASSHSQYGFANIQAGTELRPVGLRGGDDSVLVVSRDLRCRAHFKSSTVGNHLDVVVPGYGICAMASMDVFEDGNVVGSSSSFLDTAEAPCGVKSLIAAFSGIENDHLLPRFLALIGGRLQTLSLSTSFLLSRSVDLDLCSVAATCPALQKLNVSNCEVTFSDGNEASRSWEIKQLHIGGSDVDGLIRLLDDPTYRTPRELVGLRLDRRSHGRRIQSRFTPTI